MVCQIYAHISEAFFAWVDEPKREVTNAPGGFLSFKKHLFPFPVGVGDGWRVDSQLLLHTTQRSLAEEPHKAFSLDTNPIWIAECRCKLTAVWSNMKLSPGLPLAQSSVSRSGEGSHFWIRELNYFTFKPEHSRFTCHCLFCFPLHKIAVIACSVHVNQQHSLGGPWLLFSRSLIISKVNYIPPMT